MRRLLAMLLTVVLVCSMSFPAFAAEETKEIDVTAKYVSTVEGEYPAQITEGTATVEVVDVFVSVTGAPSTAVTLVVVPIPESEKEAQKWFVECLEDIGTPLAVYDIYFLTDEGNRINANGAIVTIDFPSYEGELIVCSVSTDETTKTLSSTIEDGKITFTTDSGNYYVLAEKKAAGTTNSGTTPDDPVSPPTGDDTMIWPWILVAIVALILIFFLLIWKRRKKDEDEEAHE